jgi:myo-inositol 2-dehydrogenase / D-chiro-inositol 1-dehydrogenase
MIEFFTCLRWLEADMIAFATKFSNDTVAEFRHNISVEPAPPPVCSRIRGLAMSNDPSRRTFLQTSATAVAVGGAMLASNPVHAAGSDVLKVALIGSGGRGRGAAENALLADKNVKLVALCDLFEDRLNEALNLLKKEYPNQVDVPNERKFTGFDGYKAAIDAADVVLLCSTPAFRPAHLAYAVEKGKHIFMEKPHAVDATGVRSVLESVKKAKEKNLNMVSGFCFRYHTPKRETMKRIHDGAIGDVQVIHSTYLTGELWYRGHEDKTPMEHQLRNWYYYTWLSGDFLVEQHIHNIDKIAWTMKGELPIAAQGMGGRQTRTDKKFGNIWDHFTVVFEYASGAKVFSQCRQVDKAFGSVQDQIFGTKGTAQLMMHTVTPFSGAKWQHDIKDKSDMYQTEHNELFAAIRSGKVMNDGEASAYSTLMGVMAREAAYSGQRITWEQMLNSKQNLMPKELAFGEAPASSISIPGKYQFV